MNDEERAIREEILSQRKILLKEEGDSIKRNKAGSGSYSVTEGYN
jgi:hypothetical protein